MLCRLATGSLPRAAVVVVEQPVMPPTPRATAETMARSLVFMVWIPLRVSRRLGSTRARGGQATTDDIESPPPVEHRRTTPGRDVGANRSGRWFQRREERP